MNKVIPHNLPQKNQELVPVTSNVYELLVEAKALFEGVDKYSSQVRTLEKELQKINANFPFKLKIKEEPESMSRPALEKHLEWCVGGSMLGYTLQDISYLAWEIDDVSKHFRLFLVIEEKEFVMFDYADSSGIKREFICQIKSKRPLIETDMYTRLKYCEYLNLFIQSFKEHLRNYRVAIEMGDFLLNRPATTE